MRPLWRAVLAGAGPGRALLVASSTALVSGLLLVALSYAQLWGVDDGCRSVGDGGVSCSDVPPSGDAPLMGPIEDPGTRGGSILGVVLLTVPVVLLLDQCVRLGSTAQVRRYAALVVAGATRRDLRRWGAVETGVPAAVGAALGWPVFWLLRLVLGDGLAGTQVGSLVPTVTGPGLWGLAVVALLAAYGVLVGARAAVRATRPAAHGSGRPPRPWGPALVVLGVAGLFVGWAPAEDVVIYPSLVVVLLGCVLSTPWVAWVVSGRAARLTEDPVVLMAARRVRADHGAAGRAAAAVGAVGLVLGVLGGFVVDLFLDQGVGDIGYYLVPALLVGVLALVAVGAISLSLALHSVESTLARRREMAALVATGVPVATLVDVNRAECRLVTLPVALTTGTLGALGGSLGNPVLVLAGLLTTAAGGFAVVLAARPAVRLTRPWLDAALASEQLRTE